MQLVRKYILTSYILFFVVGFLLACSLYSQTTFYLQNDMQNGNSPLNSDIWWSAPAGGQTKTDLGGTFGENRFDLNGYASRSQSSTGIASFAGTIVVGTAGAGTLELLASTWNFPAAGTTSNLKAGFDINNNLLMRLRRDTVNLNTRNFKLGSSGKAIFRAHSDTSKNLNLTIEELLGSGTLSFGAYDLTDNDAFWDLSVGNRDFAGKIELNRGTLTISNPLSLDLAELIIDKDGTNNVALTANATFGSLTYDGVTYTNGSYTANQLNTLLTTTRFTGPGTLFIPEPSSSVLFLGVLSLSLVTCWRRFKAA